MQAIKRIRKLVEGKPRSGAARTLSSLVVSLESSTPFDLADLYALDHETFELAIELMREWRLDRYYSAKFRLLDASVFAADRFETRAQTDSR